MSSAPTRTVTCPLCFKQIQIPDTLGGLVVRCNLCGGSWKKPPGQRHYYDKRERVADWDLAKQAGCFLLLTGFFGLLLFLWHGGWALRLLALSAASIVVILYALLYGKEQPEEPTDQDQ